MKEFLAAAEAIAREAGGILRQGYGETHDIRYKGEIDLLTDYDQKSEEFILERMNALFPTHRIRAEESGRLNGNAASEYEWLIDPLDGTTNYAHGFPAFAVSIALLRNEQIELGVVYDPLRDELFSALRGSGATLNGAPIRVSRAKPLSHSLLATGFPYDIRSNPENNLDHFTNFALRAQGIRRAGTAALDLAWTACGRLDGYWEFRINPWDVAAGALLVQEARGTVTDFQDGDNWLEPVYIVASNGLIHAELIAVLQQGEEAPLPA